jgi:hypothetical protein
MFEDKLKNNEERNHGRKRSTKKKNLFLGILFDAIRDMLIFTVPLFGEFSDHLGSMAAC